MTNETQKSHFFSQITNKTMQFQLHVRLAMGDSKRFVSAENNNLGCAVYCLEDKNYEYLDFHFYDSGAFFEKTTISDESFIDAFIQYTTSSKFFSQLRNASDPMLCFQWGPKIKCIVNKCYSGGMPKFKIRYFYKSNLINTATLSEQGVV